MKNLLTLCLMILTFVSYSQTPKYITVKQWKNGVLVSTKSYPLVNKVEVTKVKYVPVKSKPKVKVVKLVDTLQVEKLVVDNRKVDSLNAIINNMNNEFSKVTTQKGTYTLDKNQGTVVVEEKVSANQIVSRNFSADIKPQVKEKIVEVYRPKTVQWYMGPHITTNFTQPVQSFGISVVRKNLNDNLIQLQIGGNVHEGAMRPYPYVGIGGLLKIK
jgi:hypothetical protein